jgi:hypothetical protein
LEKPAVLFIFASKMSILAAILISFLLSPQPQVDTVRLENGTYIGEYPSGEGKFYHNERGLYIGRHERTVIAGRGMHFKPDGSRYVGNFVKGVEQGYGRLFIHTGAVICGEFRNGSANGRDTLFYPDGRVFIGIMQNNGATSQGKTYKNADAAKVTKPAFPDFQLAEEDKAFLERIRANDYDSPAVFRDGVSFFEAYIAPHFRYKESMSGKNAIVHYEFTVGEDGKISDVTITSTTDEDFSKELVRVIKRSPKWTPAMKDGRPVPYTIKNQKVHFGNPD